MAEQIYHKWTRDHYASAIKELAHIALGDIVCAESDHYYAASYVHRRALMDDTLMASVGCLDARLP